MTRLGISEPAGAEFRPPVEALLTIAEAAEALGIHVWALRRAVKAGIIPGYRPFNGRTLLRLSEILVVINASKIGGSDE